LDVAWTVYVSIPAKIKATLVPIDLGIDQDFRQRRSKRLGFLGLAAQRLGQGPDEDCILLGRLNLDTHQTACRRATAVRAGRPSLGFAGHRSYSSCLPVIFECRGMAGWHWVVPNNAPAALPRNCRTPTCSGIAELQGAGRKRDHARNRFVSPIVVSNHSTADAERLRGIIERISLAATPGAEGLGRHGRAGLLCHSRGRIGQVEVYRNAR
jgi:hypothetical protein